MRCQTPACKTIVLMLVLTLALAGCSRINLVYRNLDFLIPWSLNDYLDMTKDQQQRFEPLLHEHLSWHCRTQLPIYLAGIGRLQEELEDGKIDQTTLRTHYQDAKKAIHAIAVEITPSTIEMLGDLTESQVQELNAGLDKDRKTRQEKYLAPPLPQQIRERAERMQKRVEDWIGTTSPAQRQRILQWSHALGEQNRLWLGNRVQWQQAFREAVEQRHDDDFQQRMTRLLQNRESFWTDDYRQAFARTEQAGLDLITDLYTLSDARQQQRLNDRLKAMVSDLGTLDCLPSDGQ